MYEVTWLSMYNLLVSHLCIFRAVRTGLASVWLRCCLGCPLLSYCWNCIKECLLSPFRLHSSLSRLLICILHLFACQIPLASEFLNYREVMTLAFTLRRPSPEFLSMALTQSFAHVGVCACSECRCGGPTSGFLVCSLDLVYLCRRPTNYTWETLPELWLFLIDSCGFLYNDNLWRFLSSHISPEEISGCGWFHLEKVFSMSISFCYKQREEW